MSVPFYTSRIDRSAPASGRGLGVHQPSAALTQADRRQDTGERPLPPPSSPFSPSLPRCFSPPRPSSSRKLTWHLQRPRGPEIPHPTPELSPPSSLAFPTPTLPSSSGCSGALSHVRGAEAGEARSSGELDQAEKCLGLGMSRSQEDKN